MQITCLCTLLTISILHSPQQIRADGTSAYPNVVIATSGSISFYGSLASDGASGSRDVNIQSSPLLTGGDGCEREDFDANNGREYVALVERGKCTFSQKAAHAHASGASAMIVMNNLPALYANQTQGIFNDGCDIDCGASSSSSLSDCATSSQCRSSICTLALNPSKNEVLEYCCVKDELDEIYVNQSVAIPTVFVTIEDGQKLTQAGALNVALSFRKVTVDMSAGFIWFIGVITVAIASYRGAQAERQLANSAADGEKLTATQDDTRTEDSNEPPATYLTFAHVGAYLCCASFMLIFLYVLVTLGATWIVYFIIGAFCLASFSGISYIFVEPIVNRCMPKLQSVMCFQIKSGMLEGLEMTWGDGVTMATASLFVLWWVIERHSSYAWILQDFFGGCICCTFMVIVRLPNLKIAAALLIVFFFYDIFMVFLSPFFFHDSVMVKVATAGGHDSQSSVQGSNTCEQHFGERMPMLMLVPRTDWMGGYSMLGLGDIIFPGLLVTLMLRMDYIFMAGPCKSKQAAEAATAPVRRRTKPTLLHRVGYYPVLVPSYAFGLFLAFLANTLHLTINGVSGQPALLYLVPCTLGPAVLMAWYRGELEVLWNMGSSEHGTDDARPAVLSAAHASPHDVYTDTDDEECGGIDLQPIAGGHGHKFRPLNARDSEDMCSKTK